MAPTTQLHDCPTRRVPLVEKATFVVSTWFCSVNAPLFIKLRKEKGQRWVKITYFRNLDLLQTPQARFPVDLVGEIIRATARMYPTDHDFDMTFSDPRGTDLVIKFTPEMVKNLHTENRWRGKDKADEDGCYVHYLPTHGPNIYGRTCFRRDPQRASPTWAASSIPQWAIGFDKPFRDKVGIEYKDGVVREGARQVDGGRDRARHAGRRRTRRCTSSAAASIRNIRASRPIRRARTRRARCISAPTRTGRANSCTRQVPRWEEPHTHQDCVVFDATVKVGNTTLIDNGFLMALRDPQVVKEAEQVRRPGRAARRRRRLTAIFIQGRD